MFCKGLYLLTKGCMRIGELVSEIYYIKHTLYADSWIYYANISLFVAPHLIVLIFCLIWGLCTAKNLSEHLSHLLLTLFTVLHPLGVPDVFFSMYTFTIKSPINRNNLTNEESRQKDNLYTINYISKNCTLVEMILQSLPQLALKSYNNFLIRRWSTIGIVSICFSASSAVFSTIMALRIFDKETRVLKKSFTNVENISGIRPDDSVYDNNFYQVNN